MTKQKSPKTNKTAHSKHKKSLKPQTQADVNITLQELKKRTPKQLQLINETVQTMILRGCSIKETAKKLRLSTRAIHKRMTQYPEIQEQIEFYNRQTVDLARKRINSSSYDASNAIINLMDTTQSERMKLDSAIQILDRAGITKPDTNIQVNVLNNLRKDKDQYDL